MNPALFAVIAAAYSQQKKHANNDVWAAREDATRRSRLPLWPRLLLRLIRARTERRHSGKTWAALDEWLWAKYFSAIDKGDSE